MILAASASLVSKLIYETSSTHMLHTHARTHAHTHARARPQAAVELGMQIICSVNQQVIHGVWMTCLRDVDEQRTQTVASSGVYGHLCRRLFFDMNLFPVTVCVCVCV